MRSIIPAALVALGAVLAADRTLVPVPVSSPQTLVRCNAPGVIPGKDRVLIEELDSFTVPMGRTLIIEGVNAAGVNFSFAVNDPPNPGKTVTLYFGQNGVSLRSFDGQYPIFEGRTISGLSAPATGKPALWGYLIDN